MIFTQNMCSYLRDDFFITGVSLSCVWQAGRWANVREDVETQRETRKIQMLCCWQTGSFEVRKCLIIHHL